MKPINNFDKVKEAGGPIETLPAGGYVCEIKKAEEKPNKNSSGTHLEILFDICEGDYRGFYEADWKAQTREDKFWRGIINQNVPNETSPKYEMQCGFFKRFTNAVEGSNPGYHWDWNEAGLKGKRIGVVFGEVEKQSAKGTRYFTTRADSICSTDEIHEAKYRMPEPKRLDVASFGNGSRTAGGPVSVSVDDDDLPF